MSDQGGTGRRIIRGVLSFKLETQNYRDKDVTEITKAHQRRYLINRRNLALFTKTHVKVGGSGQNTHNKSGVGNETNDTAAIMPARSLFLKEVAD